ncbi:MAG: tyrosine-type recombinase/integrase [Exilibacterium sp.]
MNSTVSFQGLLQRFFTDRLMQQRQVSPHTISSYRDTFRLLLRFAYKRLQKSPDRLTFEDIDAPLVTAFLNDLEKSRAISPRTRNLRLTAIRSFFRYASFEAPACSAQIQRVLSMPSKRYNRTLINFLTRPEVNALLAAPDKHTWNGRRDHALLLLAVETGLRVSEITGLTRQAVTLNTGAHVDVLGKGRKQRVIPFSKRTATVLRAWIKEPVRGSSDAFFPSARGGHLSSDAVERLLKKYTVIASKVCLSLRRKRVTPHVLRHTAAMELLQVGVDPMSIALWLGHASLQTTQMYIDANLELKEKILSKVKPRDCKPGRYRPDSKLLTFLNSL